MSLVQEHDSKLKEGVLQNPRDYSQEEIYQESVQEWVVKEQLSTKVSRA